jgi:hypothetical protein
VSPSEADPALADAPDSGYFASGTRAINEGRWADAESIFAKVASERGDHADGALYWKAYAENKLGQVKPALETCDMLGRDYPSSSWNHECGALEIEIHARNGKPVEPKAGDDDDLKLLALNSLMRKDEPRAMAQIQEILNSDASSEKLKKEAVFILGHHYSDATYAQIARISYVEGDVRINRGEQEEKSKDITWEKAGADLPIETGYSLVTGEGRAEIELEDASTFYLGENSVLTISDLHTTAGVPYTEIALLTGTVSLDIKPYIAGEWFVVKTPADSFALKYPEKFTARIDCYTDAMAVTPMNGGIIHLSGGAIETPAKGQTLFYRQGHRVDFADAKDSDALAAWDKWVADREVKRSVAIADAMRASGLTSPIPGLAELNGQGTFFDCAPYGTCWEPNGIEERAQAAEEQFGPERSTGEAALEPAETHLEGIPDSARLTGAQPAAAGARPANRYSDSEVFFPCVPAALRFRTMRDPVTGRVTVVDAGAGLNPLPYRWAVCHAGSWIHRKHRYVWVVGPKRHHLEPVRWVKMGHKLGYVPIHPYDVKGRPPINRREVVFAVNPKNPLGIERIRPEPERPVELVKTPPKEFRTAHLPPLPKADEPRMMAHQVRDVLGGKTAIVKAPGIPLSFDHKSQSFLMAKQVVQGSRTTTVMAPMTNHGGNLQAHAGSYGGGSGFSGGGSHGGSASGGGSSGGGSHGGGGGGSSASSSSSSGGSSGGGAASGGGGGHH